MYLSSSLNNLLAIISYFIICDIVKSGATAGTIAAVVSGLLRTGNVVLSSLDECKSEKRKVEGNSMYFYYKAGKLLEK